MADTDTMCEGGCACGYVRYRVSGLPMIVHCCHCSVCQRQNGSAFAVNALIEADRVALVTGDVEEQKIASPSGEGQTIARCPKCHVAVWSNYFMGGLKERVRFIRVGTLDEPNLMPPDVHIFTTSKQDWVSLPLDAPVVEEFYEVNTTWTVENVRRLQVLEDEAGLQTPWRNHARA